MNISCKNATETVLVQIPYQDEFESCEVVRTHAPGFQQRTFKTPCDKTVAFKGKLFRVEFNKMLGAYCLPED